MEKSTFQFSNPAIELLNYQVNDAYINIGDSIEMQQLFSVDIRKKQDSKQAIVYLKIGINTHDEKGKKVVQKEKPFSLELTMKAIFRWNDEFDDKTIDSLLSVNAPTLLLSYARPIVSMITTSSPIGSYNIPFYNFLK